MAGKGKIVSAPAVAGRGKIVNAQEVAGQRNLVSAPAAGHLGFYTLSGRIGKVVALPRMLNYARGTRGGGALPMRVGGATSQLDLPSLTALSIAGCGRLQLLVPRWATSVITASS